MRKVHLLLLVLLAACTTSAPKQEPAADLYPYDVEERIKSLGITLNSPTMPPNVKIVSAVRTGNLIYLSGSGPLATPGRKEYKGKVGTDLTVEEGYQAARSTGINMLAVLQAEIGDLNKVVRIVKVLGMVNAEPTFTEHPQVINGFSELMIEVFGDRGQHARSAIGVASLPWNLACEVEMIVEVAD